MTEAENMQKHPLQAAEEMPIELPPIFYYDSLPSTNEKAKELLLQGHSRFVVLADEQTAGRGRLGRSFYSPPGVGLYLSYVFALPQHPKQLSLLTTAAALAVCDAIERNIQKNEKSTCNMKWPNDILMNSKKICGILVFSTKIQQEPTTFAKKQEQNQRNYAGIGIGINVSQAAADFPPELQTIAGSLFSQTGQLPSREALCRQLIRNLYDFIESDRDFSFPHCVERARMRSCTLGKKLLYTEEGQKKEGFALDLAPDGGLLIQNQAGVTQHFCFGEIE